MSNHLQYAPRWLRGRGIEIGAHLLPIEGIQPLYVDRFRDFGGSACRLDVQADAGALPFPDDSLDYVASSHLIEHLANPLAVFREWNRVLVDGGIVYAVIPDKRRTFDHPRAVTPWEHLLADFAAGTTPVDGTHIDDFVFGLDWSRYQPGATPAEAATARQAAAANYTDAVRAGREINIHFHVFTPDSFRETAIRLRAEPRLALDWRLEELVEAFPAERGDGFLVIFRIRKSMPRSIARCVNWFRRMRNPRFPLPAA